MEKEKNNKNRSQEPTHISRRMFLQFGLWISGLASAWGFLRFLSYEIPGETLLPSIVLDQPTAYLKGSETFIPEVRAWLVHDDEGFYAVSSTCTHLGCTVSENKGKFVCPCHGSEYDLTGRVLQGPAASSLPNFEVKLSEDNRIEIDRRVEVPRISRLKP